MNKRNKKGFRAREWIRDRIIFLALIIFASGAGLYITSVKLFPADSIWLHPVKEFGLLIAMIGVVSLGYELFLRELTFNEYKEALEDIVNPHAVRLGIQGIYKNRSEIGQAHTFQNLFKEVKHEIFIGGTSLLSISTGSRDLLKEKVLNGIKVRLLIMDPESEIVEFITKQIGGKATFKNEIRTSLLLLQSLQDEINESDSPNKGSLTVHTYKTIPAHSFFSTDVDEPHGIIITDLGPYLGKNHQRPSMLLVNKKKGLYQHYRALNQTLWEESLPSTTDAQKIAGPKTKTHVFTSGKATQYFDVEADEWRKASLCEMNSGWRGIQGSRWVWIRDEITLEEAKTGSQHQFRMQFEVPGNGVRDVKRAELYVRSDDTCHITVNDVSLKQEYGGADFADPFIIDILQYLKSGANTITFEVINYAKPSVESPEENPSGLIYRLHLEVQE